MGCGRRAYALWALPLEAAGPTEERRSVVLMPLVGWCGEGTALRDRTLDGREECSPLQPGGFDMAEEAVLGVTEGGAGGCASGLYALSTITVGVG